MRMRPWRAWLAVLCLGGIVTAARADEAPPEPITGNVQFMTNYVGRGLAQSLGNPSVEGELDYNNSLHDGLYGGLEGTSTNWVDQVYPGDSVDVEIDFWAGWRAEFGRDWVVKAGFLRLQFPGTYVQQKTPTDEPNTTEAFGYVAWRGFSLRYNYAITNSFAAPDSKGSSYLDASANQEPFDGWQFTEHVGRKNETGTNPVTGSANSRNNYTDYKLAVGYALTSSISLTLAHTWTTANPALYTLNPNTPNSYFVGGHHTWLLLEKDF